MSADPDLMVVTIAICVSNRRHNWCHARNILDVLRYAEMAETDFGTFLDRHIIKDADRR